jgi:sugar (pentulose or hexulose) kinase
MRSQLYGVFTTLALGMRVLARERVAVDRLLAHGGLFRTAGVAQRMLAAAVNTPVSIATSASEGGAWGIAVLAAFASQRGSKPGLGDYLRGWVFRDVDAVAVTPDAADAAGFRTYLDRYTAGLEAERVAATAIPLRRES